MPKLISCAAVLNGIEMTILKHPLQSNSNKHNIPVSPLIDNVRRQEKKHKHSIQLINFKHFFIRFNTTYHLSI